MSRPIKLFFSYSHHDEKLRDELAKRLSTLRRNRVIADWHDREIGAGENWAQAIEENLKSADIILLLVSPDFLHSEFCNDVELTQAMERHAVGEACVIPIILRPCYWEDETFASLQALPKNAKPITSWIDRDEALLDVEKGIRAAIKRLSQKTALQSQNLEQEAPTSLQIAPIIEDEGQKSEQEAPTSLPIASIIEDDARNLEQEARNLEQEAPNFLPIAPIIEDNARNLEQEAPNFLPIAPIIEDRGQISAIENQTVSSLPTFKFEIITVNDRGQEIDRRPGEASYFREELEPGVFLDMVSIPGGTFWMGEGASQKSVEVEPFFMGKFAVTQAQWRAIAKLPKIDQDLKLEPSYFKGDNQPVEQVSWHEAIEFCNRLSYRTGKQYRLPSETEWEYACRARTTTPFHFGETVIPELVNCEANEGHPVGVGSLPPNAFGLHEMHGNVWEWCEDQDNIAVLRGGSCDYYMALCRSAFRSYNASSSRSYDIGFRIVCSIRNLA